MSEFRIVPNDASNRSRDLRIRLVSWGMVLVLSAITVFAVYGARSASRELTTALTWLAVLVLVGAIVGARSLAFRLGMERVEREMVFVLTDNELVRKRSGWPDVRIGLSKMSSLYERHGWLVVERASPHTRIAIPATVDGFVLLREELAKYRPVTGPSRRWALSPTRFHHHGWLKDLISLSGGPTPKPPAPTPKPYEKQMLRRVLLVVMATVISFGLTAGGGYIMYTFARGQSEIHLSLLIRFIFNPLIALVIGALVGFLSKDHPLVTSIIGIAPWAMVLHGSMSIGPVLDYVALCAIAAIIAWRLRRSNRSRPT